MIHSWWQVCEALPPARWIRVCLATTAAWTLLLAIFTFIHSVDMTRLGVAHTIVEIVQAQSVIMVPWLAIFPAVALTRTRQVLVATPIGIALTELVLLGVAAIGIVYLHIVFVYSPYLGAPPEQVLDQIPLINWVWDPVMIALTALIGELYARSLLAGAAARSETSAGEKVILRSGRQDEILDVADIIAVSAQGNYVAFITETRERLHRATLAELMVQLTDLDFLHIHRSHLIRSSLVATCERARGRIVKVTLETGHTFPVSARGADILQAHLAATTSSRLPVRA